MKCTMLLKPKIKELMLSRSKLGYAATDLANKAGLHYSTIYAIESGRSTTVVPRTAKKISDALNMEMDELFDFDLEMETRQVNHLAEQED